MRNFDFITEVIISIKDMLHEGLPVLQDFQVLWHYGILW